MLHGMSDTSGATEPRRCRVCGSVSGAKHYCGRCSRLLSSSKRKGTRAARLRALRDQWSADHQAFMCKYTDTALMHSGGARDAEWEHRTPGDADSVVLVAAVVYRMKADLTEAQWDDMIRALYEKRIECRPFSEKAFPSNWQPKSTARRRGTGSGGDSAVSLKR
jgi:hypothetical protein